MTTATNDHGTVKALVNLLTVGDDFTFTAHGRTFTVKRLRRTVYNLRDHAVWERSRFGTRQQIAEDVQVALDYGHLPPPVGPRW